MMSSERLPACWKIIVTLTILSCSFSRVPIRHYLEKLSSNRHKQSWMRIRGASANASTLNVSISSDSSSLPDDGARCIEKLYSPSGNDEKRMNKSAACHEGINSTIFEAVTWALAYSWAAKNTLNSTTLRQHNFSLPCLPLRIHFDLTNVTISEAIRQQIEEVCAASSRLLTPADLGFPVEGEQRRTDVLDSSTLRAIYSSLSLSLSSSTIESTSSEDDFVVFMDATLLAKSTPLYYYAERIPTYAKSIQLVIRNDDSCIPNDTNRTLRYFQTMFPRAIIATEMVQSEWSLVAATILLTPNVVVCDDSSLCLLRVLLHKGAKNTRTMFMVNNFERFPWLSDLIRTHESSIAHSNNNAENNAKTLERNCLALRGRSGHWIQDWNYARDEAQYSTPLTKWSNFTNLTTPYRDATTYKWVDDECPLELMTLDKFCNVLQELGTIRRVMIVGDSLNGHMALSLWKLLGHTDDPQLQSQPGKHWIRNVTCAGGDESNSSTVFELSMYRNDHLDDTNVTSADLRRKCTGGKGDFCLAWANSYFGSTSPTLLIANFGAHVYGTREFEGEMDDFLALLDRFPRPQDIVTYRTTVPGHVNCQHATGPLNSYQDFGPMLQHAPHSWDIFISYNDYAQSTIAARNQRLDLRMHVLDVVPMTVLRPDGHVSGLQKCDDCTNNDCLHYILPGPTDWWNHMLYSNLATMAARQEL